ncbi:MAG: hypothetical protein GX031_14000 [Candidatus Riflebacteria bacterium]|nr:hypothetical protein [Candidatus Riflebacteria bacterium]
MKSVSTLKYLVFILFALAVLSVPAVIAVSIPQQIEELKMDYERKYREYTQAIQDSKNSLAAELSKEVALAKKRYDEARAALTPSDQTKTNAKNAVTKVTDTVKKVFAIGRGGESTATENSANTKKRLEGYEEQQISINGNNYCGQFAMTAVFKGLGITADSQKIYEDTNPAGIFTAPTTITEYLNMNGVDAVSKQNASLSDIVKKIDAGLPAMVLMSTADGTPHWVSIYGYDCDTDGKVVSVEMRDSYWGTKSGYKMGTATFLSRWNSPLGSGFGSNFVSYKNVMIDIKGTKTKDKSPSIFNFNISTATEDNIANGINDVVTGFKTFDITRFLGGTAKCVLGIPGAAAGVVSTGVSSLGNKVNDWGKSTFAQSGAANKIAGGGAVLVGTTLKIAGAVGKTAGNILSGVASAAGNFINKLGYVFR